ncbi:MAG: hypothetical protein KC649_03855, partial [Candidatus Omnitrophica bacterium]|nr:hypothetical protein [Candidatus Omnitrophota bacterium]
MPSYKLFIADKKSVETMTYDYSVTFDVVERRDVIENEVSKIIDFENESSVRVWDPASGMAPMGHRYNVDKGEFRKTQIVTPNGVLVAEIYKQQIVRLANGLLKKSGFLHDDWNEFTKASVITDGDEYVFYDLNQPFIHPVIAYSIHSINRDDVKVSKIWRAFEYSVNSSGEQVEYQYTEESVPLATNLEMRKYRREFIQGEEIAKIQIDYWSTWKQDIPAAFLFAGVSMFITFAITAIANWLTSGSARILQQTAPTLPELSDVQIDAQYDWLGANISRTSFRSLVRTYRSTTSDPVQFNAAQQTLEDAVGASADQILLANNNFGFTDLNAIQTARTNLVADIMARIGRADMGNEQTFLNWRTQVGEKLPHLDMPDGPLTQDSITFEDRIVKELIFATAMEVRATTPTVQFYEWNRAMQIMHTQGADRNQIGTVYQARVLFWDQYLRAQYKYDNPIGVALGYLTKQQHITYEDLEDWFRMPEWLSRYESPNPVNAQNPTGINELVVEYKQQIEVTRGLMDAEVNRVWGEIKNGLNVDDSKRRGNAALIEELSKNTKTFKELIRRLTNSETLPRANGQGFFPAGMGPKTFPDESGGVFGWIGFMQMFATILPVLWTFVPVMTLPIAIYMITVKVMTGTAIAAAVVSAWPALAGIAFVTAGFFVAGWISSRREAASPVRHHAVAGAGVENQVRANATSTRETALGLSLLLPAAIKKIIWNSLGIFFLMIPVKIILASSLSIAVAYPLIAIIVIPVALFMIIDSMTFYYEGQGVMGFFEGLRLGQLRYDMLGLNNSRAWKNMASDATSRSGRNVSRLEQQFRDKMIPAHISQDRHHDIYLSQLNEIVEDLYQNDKLSLAERDQYLQSIKQSGRIDGKVPANDEAFLRLKELYTSLYDQEMPTAPTWADLKSLTVTVTSGGEILFTDLKGLNVVEAGTGVTKLTHLVTRYTDEWMNFTRRMSADYVEHSEVVE